MKHFLILLATVWASVAMAADEEDFLPTPRDEAVANLASKRTEAQLLRTELGVKTQERDTAAKNADYARTQIDELRAMEAKHLANGGSGVGPDGRGSSPYYEWIANLATDMALEKAAKARLEQINARLKELDAEIKQAKENLQKFNSPPGKGDSRSNLRPQNNPRPSTPPRSTGDNCGKHPPI